MAVSPPNFCLCRQADTQLYNREQWVIILSFALSTFIDVVITGCMCFYLQRSRSGFSQYVLYLAVDHHLERGAGF